MAQVTRITLLLVCLLALTSRAQLTISDCQYLPGNGYNLFVRTINGTEPNTVYLWQASTNLTTWYDDGPPFVGAGQPLGFFSLVDPIEPQRFYRVKLIGVL